MQKTKSMKPAILAASAGIVLLAGLAAWYLSPGGPANNADAVPIGGPFELTSEDGERVSDADFAGRYMLLYFGYTYCPDICPAGLATLSAAYDLLPEDKKAEIAPVFITVDPERDTPEVVAEYTDLFHDDLLGLTGTVDEIEATKATFRVYAKKAGDDPENYLVDHATFTYLIGPDGKYVTHFNHGDSAEEIAQTILEKTG